MKAVFLVASFVVANLCAETLTQNQIETAARNFLANDGIAGVALPSRSLASVRQRGSLWIASLAPSGYLVLSGSDAAEPVPAFSDRDFEEPEAGTAFAVLLDAVETAQRAEGRNAKWQELLASSRVSALSKTPQSSLIVYTPAFLATEWVQGQPYNDYSPVLSSSADSDKRGRAPDGCVATAYAQIMNYWQWPARMDETRTFAHSVTADGGDTYSSYPIRFDGRVPFSWDFDTLYPDYGSYGYDMRGFCEESRRYPIARLLLLCDSLAYMDFANESAAIVYDPTVNPWYTATNCVFKTNLTYEVFVSTVRASMTNRVPAIVGIPGHAVVADGWAEDASGTAYCHINYGYGFAYKGWYNLNETDTSSVFKCAFGSLTLGQKPRPTVQLDPLPAVSPNAVTLSWHLPWCYTNSVAGFTLTALTTSGEPATWLDDFSASKGVSSTQEFKAGTFSGIGNETPCLRFRREYSGSYVFTNRVLLTSRSVLTYRLRSQYADRMMLEIQMQGEDGAWETLEKPGLNTANTDSGWALRRVYLGGRGGAVARFQLVLSYVTDGWTTDDSAHPEWGVFLDDFQVTDAVPFTVAKTESIAGGTARSAALSSLVGGTKYLFAVTPWLPSAEASSPILTTVAGTGTAYLPGTETARSSNCVFVAADGVWSLSAECAVTDGVVRTGQWNGSIRASVQPSAGTIFHFQYKAPGIPYAYWGVSAYNSFTVTFTDDSGNAAFVWGVTNSAAITDWQTADVALGGYAGKKGTVTATYYHSGAYRYSWDDNAGFWQGLSVSPVVSMALPELLTGTVTRTASAMPSILTVTSGVAVAEGFYRECANGGKSVLCVQCSGGVTSLEARPSHLAVLPDSAVSVYSRGGGWFDVVLDGSAITSAQNRTRMILTLVAKDANGSAAYKDLSLRFSTETAGQAYTAPAAQTATSTTPVAVPYEWLITNGLASTGAGAQAFEEAAFRDDDGDGFTAWEEYLCGTVPTDAASFFKCGIEMIGGSPRISWTPDWSSQGRVYTPIGKTNLTDVGATWMPTNSAHRFFKVRVELE